MSYKTVNKLTMLAASIFCVIQLNAQPLTTFGGVIKDSALRAIKEANVRLLNTNFEAITNKDGSFTFRNVYPGEYTLRVNALGFPAFSTVVQAGKDANDQVIIMKGPALLDEVIVTASKREEILQKTPLSITALTSRQVEEYRLWNIKEVTAIVPNFYSADPGDRRNVSAIRGIATTSYDPAVGTYIDGVNQFSLDTYIGQLFDVERIEVLRGPQGTLYGRNSMAGVINVITKQPTNQRTGFAEVSIGNRGLQRYSAGLKTPIFKDKLFFGAAMLYEGFNGFYKNDFTNSRFDKQHSITGNYYLKYLPLERLAITLNLKHNNNRNNGAFTLVNGVEEAFANPYHLSQNALTKLVDNTLNSSLSFNYSGRYFNLNSQTSWQSNYRYYEQPIDADFAPIDAITLKNNYGKDWNNVKVITQELRLTSPSYAGKLKWTAGAYYFHQDNPVKQAIHFGKDAAMVGSPDVDYSLINTTRAKGNGIAFYGQATFAIIKNLSFTGGLRYDHEKRSQGILGEYQPDASPVPVFDFQPDTAAKASFNAFSPKATLSYQLAASHLIFTGYTRGYRPGGLTPLSSDPSQPALFAFKPEYSNNYEAGTKNTFLNNHLSINLTAFYTTINDAQVPSLILPDAVTIIKNTGSLKSKGIELETSTSVKGLRLDYNLGYTHATFSNLKLAQYGNEVDLKGKRQIFTPDVTSLFAAQYSLLLATKQNLKLNIRGEWHYLGKQYFDLANTIVQNGYSLFNTRIEIGVPRLSISFWGRNWAGKKYISYAYDFGAVHLGNSRTFGVTLSAKI